MERTCAVAWPNTGRTCRVRSAGSAGTVAGSNGKAEAIAGAVARALVDRTRAIARTGAQRTLCGSPSRLSGACPVRHSEPVPGAIALRLMRCTSATARTGAVTGPVAHGGLRLHRGLGLHRGRGEFLGLEWRIITARRGGNPDRNEDREEEASCR
jgi:hypothetical protein